MPINTHKHVLLKEGKEDKLNQVELCHVFSPPKTKPPNKESALTCQNAVLVKRSKHIHTCEEFYASAQNYTLKWQRKNIIICDTHLCIHRNGNSVLFLKGPKEFYFYGKWLVLIPQRIQIFGRFWSSTWSAQSIDFKLSWKKMNVSM